MTFDDEFQARLNQLDNTLGPLQDIPAERLAAVRRDYARDPHAGCWQPHHGPDGYTDCSGRAL